MKDLRRNLHILFLSHWYPFPPDNGSKIRIYNLLKFLSEQHIIDLIAFSPSRVTEDRLSHMREICREVEVVLYHPFRPTRLRALLGYFSRRPRSVVDTYSEEMRNLIDRIYQQMPPDIVVASQSGMAHYASYLQGPPKIFEEFEVSVLYEQFATQKNQLSKLRYGLTWWKKKNYLANLLYAFNGATVVSEKERDQLHRIAPRFSPVAIVPNGVDVEHYKVNGLTPEPDTLVYSGALTYSANFDAVDFFLREIFPLIQAKRPEARFFVTGSLDSVPVERLPKCEGVIFTGYLKDIRPRVAGSRVSVVPLRKGGGTRLKILESLALGTPVVTTKKGVEGLELVHERDLLVADQPQDFADSVVRLLVNDAECERISFNGRARVVEHYGWRSIGKSMDELIQKLVT